MTDRTRALIEEIAVDFLGAALMNEALVIEEVSSGVLELGGHEREGVVGLTAFDVVHPDDLERAAAALGEFTRTRLPTVDGWYRMLHGDGTYGDYAISAMPVEEFGESKIALRFGAVTDVLRADEFARETVDALRMIAGTGQLEESFEFMHRLAERHAPGVRLAISTLDGAITVTHRRGSDQTFQTDEQPTEIPPNVVTALDRHREGPWRAFTRMAEFETTPEGGLITSVLTDDDDELVGWIEAARSSHEEPDDREWMVHGMVRQALSAVLRRVRLDRQLRDAADHDPLTGLANRRRLFNDMEAKDDLASTSVLLIDLDNFSWINNNLGHHVGDQALVALADRLRQLCPPDATIARFGGDEFVIWCPTSLADPAQVDADLRSWTVMPAGTADRRSSLRCSIGAITIRADESAADAIKRADEAMYVAKRGGGDRVHVA